MKSKFTIFALLALILLPSCVVTRSRYGNGLSIEMPEVFKKGERNKHETKQKPERRKIRFSSNQQSDSVLIAVNDTLKIESNDSQFSTAAPVIASHPVSPAPNKVNNKKLKSVTKKTKPVYKTNSSESITSASEHKSQQNTNASMEGDGFLDMLFELFLALIIGMAIITFAIYLIITLLPADVAAIILLSLCILGWLIDLLG